MFFRVKPSGPRRYLQLVENTRDGTATRQRVLATLGRIDDAATNEARRPAGIRRALLRHRPADLQPAVRHAGDGGDRAHRRAADLRSIMAADRLCGGDRAVRGRPRLRLLAGARSEERRVGKECRCRWSPYHEKKKEVRMMW